jgi:hypothetical protein
MSRVRWAGVVPLWVALACGGLGQSERSEIVPAPSDGSDAPALDSEPPRSAPEVAIASPIIHACLDVRRAGDLERSEAPFVDMSASGTIEEVGVGLPGTTVGGECPFVSGGGYFGQPSSLEDLDQLAQLTWIRIRARGGESVLLTIIAPGFQFRDRVGETVELAFHSSAASFSPTQSWLELRRADGSLILWLSEAGRVEELLGANDIERSLGAVDGVGGDDCVTSWERRRVNITLDGVHTSVGYQQQAAVGPWRVTNGGVVIQTGDSRCSDAYALFASLAVWSEADTVAYTSGIGGWCDPALTAEVGNYYDGKSFVCLEGEGSEGYLSMSCESDEGCLPGSACSEGLCRATD